MRVRADLFGVQHVLDRLTVRSLCDPLRRDRCAVRGVDLMQPDEQRGEADRSDDQQPAVADGLLVPCDLTV